MDMLYNVALIGPHNANHLCRFVCLDWLSEILCIALHLLKSSPANGNLASTASKEVIKAIGGLVSENTVSHIQK